LGKVLSLLHFSGLCSRKSKDEYTTLHAETLQRYNATTLQRYNATVFTHMPINLNYYTDAKALQRILEGPIDKRSGRTYGPPGTRSK
jgi:hypothetical protein